MDANAQEADAVPAGEEFEPPRSGADSTLAALSNAMVRLYKEKFGRGPTRARSDYAGADTLIVSLEYTLTAVERTMLELGEHQRIEETRLFFQKAARNEFIGAAEEITGRKVRAFVSGMDTHVDIATEIFYFEPRK
jgi:uncharacterized protein YbcI